MTDHLLSVLPLGLVIAYVTFLFVSLMVEPKCKKCGTPLTHGGWYDEHTFCPNTECPRYQEWSYE